MQISQTFFGPRRLFSGLPAGAAFLVLVFCASLVPSTAHAQRFGSHGERGFGRGFGGGLGWGLGVGIGSALVYDSAYYYSPPVVYTAEAPTIYYIQQPVQPQTVVVNPAPAATPATAPAPAAPATAPTTSSAGQMSKIVYDANGKPLGVLILNPDGSQQFVPLAQ